jgi:hypothetical protein
LWSITMAVPPIDITGQRFGKLVVTGVRIPPEPGKKRQWKWECACDCGAKTKATGTHLRKGDVTSCGCAASRKTMGARIREKWLNLKAEDYLAANSAKQGSGCIFWTGAIGSRGYGVSCLHGEIVAAHRLAYETFVGEIPDGMFVCHHCDTPHCINPEHLFLGTHNDNMQDKVRKSRHSHGEVHGMAKLTEEQARFVLQSAEPGRVLAMMFGVTADHIAMIRKGRAWRHLHNEVRN